MAGASQDRQGFRIMVGDAGSASVQAAQSSILSSAEQRGARIEGCGLVTTGHAYRILGPTLRQAQGAAQDASIFGPPNIGRTQEWPLQRTERCLCN